MLDPGWKPTILEVLKMCLDVANGMSYLHTAFENHSNNQTQPIIHRDLKTANLLVASNPLLEDGDLIVKVTDFGLSRDKAMAESLWDPQTVQMTGCGSVLWMAPEILSGDSCEQSFPVIARHT